MKRIVSLLVGAVPFAALALLLALCLPGPARMVRAADINERCNDCQLRTEQHFEQCQATFGTEEQRCYDQFNRDIVNCYREFCEQ